MLNIFNNIFSIIVVTLVIIYVVFAIIELFKFKNYRILSAFLLTATCCQGVSFCLGETSYRTLLALTIICIICTASIITKIFSSIKENEEELFSMFVLVLLFCGSVNMFQIFLGYNYNKMVIASTLQSIENYRDGKSDVIEINTNIDKNFSHIMGYENGAFEDYYFKYYGIYENKDDIYFIGGDNSNISINNTRLKYPAIYENNKTYIPLRFAIEAANGTCDWTKEKTTYKIDEKFVVIGNSTNLILESSNSSLVGSDISPYLSRFFDRVYIDIEYFDTIFDDSLNEIKITNNTTFLASNVSV